MILCIRGISRYGTGDILATQLEHYVKATSHEPGETHTISVFFLAMLAGINGYTLELLIAWANTGLCYIALEWTFPQSPYPRLNTRHLLVAAKGAPAVSFGGGLGFAIRILNYVQSTGMGLVPRSGKTSFPLCHGVGCLDQSWTKASSPQQNTTDSWNPGQPHWTNWHGHIPRNTAPFAPEAKPMERPPADCSHQWDEDHRLASLGSIESTATKYSETDNSSFSQTDTEYTGSTSGQFSSGLEYQFDHSCTINDGEDENIQRITQQPQPQPYDRCANQPIEDEQQRQIEILTRQKERAEAMFAHNGDTSGFVNSMAIAPRFPLGWDPFGMPRF